MKSYTVQAFTSPIVIKWGDSVFDAFVQSISSSNYQLEPNDVVIITSKVVSMEEETRALIESVEPGEEAKEVATQASMDPRVAQLVLDESEGQIYGAVFHAILAKTRFGLTANAGIDLSNSPEGYALLLPRDPDKYAREFREKIRNKFGVTVAVLVTDSRTIPLKRGTTGVTLGVAGLKPVEDDRGSKDLYGYKMTITTRAVADNLATAANIVMGETSEQRPFAVIRGAEFTSTEEKVSMDETMMPEDQCLYFSPFIELLHGERKWL